jgi:hypothetical protein
MVLLIGRATSQIANGGFRKSLIPLVCGALLASSLCQRFLPRYEKDDYRSASATAKAAVSEGKTIWWAADPVLGEYYGLVDSKSGSGRVIWFNNGVRNKQDAPAPDLIFLSKPDVHDPDGVVVSRIKDGDYEPIAEFSAFRVYAPKGRRKN